jgi:hypothetical protein
MGAAIEAVGCFQGLEPTRCLLRCFADYPDYQWTTVKAMGEVGAEEFVPTLVTYGFEGGSLSASILVPKVLGEIGTDGARDGVIALLGSQDLEVRVAAASALLAFPSAKVESILPVLLSTNIAIRASAVNALGFIRDPHCVQYVDACMFDPEPEIRMWALDALSNRIRLFEGTKLSMLARKTLDDPSSDVRLDAYRLLRACGCRDPVLIDKARRDPDERIQGEGAEWALSIGDDRVAPEWRLVK